MPPFRKQEHINRIEEQLDRVSTRVNKLTKIGLNDAAKFVEPFAAGLLNLIYGWELRDPAPGIPNTKAIDLFDERNSVAVQVSIQGSSAKVKHTEVMLANQKYKTVYIFFLHKKKFRKKPAVQIITIETVMGELMGRRISFLKQVFAYLEEELNNSWEVEVSTRPEAFVSAGVTQSELRSGPVNLLKRLSENALKNGYTHADFPLSSFG